MEVNRWNTYRLPLKSVHFERKISYSLHQIIKLWSETDFSNNVSLLFSLFMCWNCRSYFQKQSILYFLIKKSAPRNKTKQIFSIGWFPDYPPDTCELYAGLNFINNLWIWRIAYAGDFGDFSVQPRRNTLLVIVCDQPSSGHRRSFRMWCWTEWSVSEHISGDGDKWVWNNGGTMNNRRKSKKIEEKLLQCYLAFKEYHMNS